jgi:hypothetical protein
MQQLMKKNFLFLFLTLLFLLFVSAHCKKDHNKAAVLPPATQEGKNTIGFTINGEVWVPYAKCSAFANPCREIFAGYGVSGGASPNGIGFSFFRVRNGIESSLIISSAFATITSVGEKIDSIGVTFLSENMNGNNGYFTGPLNGSKFYITKIDFSAQIISGEFEFILLEQNGSGNKLILKDGRFDFTFNACKCSN